MTTERDAAIAAIMERTGKTREQAEAFLEIGRSADTFLGLDGDPK